MYCTTSRDPETVRLQWRELKVAAVYEVTHDPSAGGSAGPPGPVGRGRQPPTACERNARWVREQAPEALVAPADRAVRLSYVAQTGPWQELGARLPRLQVTRILDLPHAQEHLWTVSRAVFGEANSAGSAWAQAPLRALEQGAVHQVVAVLEVLRQRGWTNIAAGLRRYAWGPVQDTLRLLSITAPT